MLYIFPFLEISSQLPIYQDSRKYPQKHLKTMIKMENLSERKLFY